MYTLYVTFEDSTYKMTFEDMALASFVADSLFLDGFTVNLK